MQRLVTATDHDLHVRKENVQLLLGVIGMELCFLFLIRAALWHKPHTVVISLASAWP